MWCQISLRYLVRYTTGYNIHRYHRMFVALNSIKPNVIPKLFMLDFGDAALNAVMHVYPDILQVTIHVCKLLALCPWK